MKEIKWFKIEYNDPKTGERKEIETSFEHTAEWPAWKWADDRGYMLADKGWYKITEISK